MVSILFPIVSFGSIGWDLNTTRKYKKRLAEEAAVAKQPKTEFDKSKRGWLYLIGIGPIPGR